MKFAAISKNLVPKLKGITIDIDSVNDQPKILTLIDSDGNLVRVGDLGGYSSLLITVAAPPKMVKKYKLAGSLKGLAVEELFEEKYLADDRMRELAGLASDSDLAITEVEVEEK